MLIPTSDAATESKQIANPFDGARVGICRGCRDERRARRFQRARAHNCARRTCVYKRSQILLSLAFGLTKVQHCSGDVTHASSSRTHIWHIRYLKIRETRAYLIPRVCGCFCACFFDTLYNTSVSEAFFARRFLQRCFLQSGERWKRAQNDTGLCLF